MPKVIITAALTGGLHTKKANPSLPEQPEEIAQAAYECYNAGAAIVHIHARDRNGAPTGEAAVYKEIHQLIRATCNIIIQDTTGGGQNLTFEERLGCLQAEPEMASLNMGSLLRTIGPHAGTMFVNTHSDIEFVAREMLKRNIKPEMEIYHHGMFREVNHVIVNKLVERPYYVNFVLGMAYQGAVEATAENLFTLKQLLPADTIFNVSAIGPAQLPITTMSMLLGGMVRVGLEDNIYYSRGVLAKSNAQLVERAVRIARELGVDITSPDEARDILGLRRQGQKI